MIRLLDDLSNKQAILGAPQAIRKVSSILERELNQRDEEYTALRAAKAAAKQPQILPGNEPQPIYNP